MTNTPIISGFHPDPSICRVGDTYYIANSSFEYVPGVPLHKSTDLTTWTSVTNILSGPAQLDVQNAPPSTGVYATTLRYHNGRFWMITTNVIEMTRGHLIVSAEQPEGPWSDAVHVDGSIGIDPDLYWQSDGTCHCTWMSNDPATPGIVTARIHPQTGTLLSPPQRLWQGTGLAFPEGPHLFQKDGWWYLLLSEGGTERGHAVTIARARTLDGPFEPAPTNPIFSHRSTAHPVQNTGHADFVETADGSWAMVYLGVRPSGQTPMFHGNGRETFLAGIDWVDGWPVVDENRYAPTPPDYGFVDTFTPPGLDNRWISPNHYPDSSWLEPSDGGGLTIKSGPDGARLLVSRTRNLQWEATAEIGAVNGQVRFLVRVDHDHWYGISVNDTKIRAEIQVGPAWTPFAPATRDPSSMVSLRISARTPRPTPPIPRNEADIVELAIVNSDGSATPLAAFDGRYVSTEVAGGFTGRVFGIEVVDGECELRSIAYTPLDNS